ncbi:recombinase family protein [Streptosporangium sp. CA-115845]|uniref:recombinase family protein n=1 Tax=Streptosporangium sp. CA-115845 TaxID=3240071 RepID=UPI003D8B08D0
MALISDPVRWVLYAFAAEDMHESLERQFAVMRDHVASAGGVVVGEHSDVGSHRSGRAAAFAQVGGGGADRVLVFDLGRLTRKTAELEQVRQLVLETGADLHAVRQGRIAVGDLTVAAAPIVCGWLQESRARRVARITEMKRQLAERAERVGRLEKDLRVTVKPWCCPCLLRHPERRDAHERRRRDVCGIDYGGLLDHGSSWWRDGRLFAVVSEPYDIAGEDVAALTASCAPYGLGVLVSGEHAVHFPPRTLAVIVTRAEERVPDRDE